MPVDSYYKPGFIVKRAVETNDGGGVTILTFQPIDQRASYEINFDAVVGAVKYHFFLEKESDYPYQLVDGIDYLSPGVRGWKIGESTSPSFTVTLVNDGAEYTAGVVAESGVGVYSAMTVQTFNVEAYSELLTTSGRMRPLTGNEILANEKLGLKTSHRFYCAVIDVVEKDRIYDSIRNKNYDVKFVKNPMEMDDHFEIDCELIDA